MLETVWIPTEHAVYAAIYAVHHRELTVYATHSCSEGGCEFHGESHVMTEWGFKGADGPLIRSVGCGDELETRQWVYYIAQSMEERS
mgnify:CR=1 FL=1